jgi:hypothetical protein
VIEAAIFSKIQTFLMNRKFDQSLQMNKMVVEILSCFTANSLSRLLGSNDVT